MAYGIYGSNKNVWNSVLMIFRGHPNTKITVPVFNSGCDRMKELTQASLNCLTSKRVMSSPFSPSRLFFSKIHEGNPKFFFFGDLIKSRV
jgi:hypothetical protein